MCVAANWYSITTGLPRNSNSPPLTLEPNLSRLGGTTTSVRDQLCLAKLCALHFYSVKVVERGRQQLHLRGHLSPRFIQENL